MLDQVPDAFMDRVDEVAHALLGSRDATGAELGRRVARLSRIYTRERREIATLAGSRELLAARLRFQLPRDLPKVTGPLAELAAADALPASRQWRVLDLGAGLGASCLGAALYARCSGRAERLHVTAVDKDPAALRILEELARTAGSSGLAAVRAVTRREDFAQPSPPLPSGPFDLVLMGLALNELGGDEPALDRAEELLAGAASRLAGGGSLIVIEPALRSTSRFLHRVRDRMLSRALPIAPFAPCLHRGPCPMLETQRDWCHEEVTAALPEALREVARAAGLRSGRLTYSYLTLHQEGRSLSEIGHEGRGELYRIVSGLLPSKGKLEVFACGRLGRPRLMRLRRHRSDSNDALGSLGRGALTTVDPGVPEGDRLRVGPDCRVRRLL